MTVAIIERAFEDAKRLTWPQPDRAFLSQNVPAPIMPLGMFGALAPLIEDLAQDTSSPIDWTACTILGAAGSLLSGRTRVQPHATSSWLLSPILWMCLVGDPSSRKSPSMDNAVKPLTQLENDHLRASEKSRKAWKAGQSSRDVAAEKYKKDVRSALQAGDAQPERPAALDEDTKPAVRRLQVVDISIEQLCHILVDSPEGILSRRGELSGWFENMSRYNKGSDMAFWLEGYDAAYYTMDRRNIDEPLIIPALCLSLLGTTQPDKMNQILDAPHDGCAARMLFIWPDPVAYARPKKRTDTKRLYEVYRWLDQVEFTAQGRPRIIPFSAKADEQFEQWLIKLDRKQARARGISHTFSAKQAARWPVLRSSASFSRRRPVMILESPARFL